MEAHVNRETPAVRMCSLKREESKEPLRCVWVYVWFTPPRIPWVAFILNFELFIFLKFFPVVLPRLETKNFKTQYLFVVNFLSSLPLLV